MEHNNIICIWHLQKKLFLFSDTCRPWFCFINSIHFFFTHNRLWKFTHLYIASSLLSVLPLFFALPLLNADLLSWQWRRYKKTYFLWHLTVFDNYSESFTVFIAAYRLCRYQTAIVLHHLAKILLIFIIWRFFVVQSHSGIAADILTITR